MDSSSKDNPVCCIHLVDGASGAPMVLRMLLEGLLREQVPVSLLVSNAELSGPLHSVAGLNVKHFLFRWHSFRWLRFLFYLISQIHLFFLVLKETSASHTLFINTLLPCGAAIAGKMRGQTVIYHVHENRIPPAPFDWLLKACCRFCASRIVFVSAHSAQQFPFSEKNVVVSNALPSRFFSQAQHLPDPDPLRVPFSVCMASYPRTYKGVDVFYNLAKCLPDICFLLALSSDGEETRKWVVEHPLPPNLHVYSRLDDVLVLYGQAHVVMNLSLPEMVTETFGLTALEGMACGLPAIVPPAGGIAELVRDGLEGFHINPHQTSELIAALRRLRDDPVLYHSMSRQARLRALEYKETDFMKKMGSLLQ